MQRSKRVTEIEREARERERERRRKINERDRKGEEGGVGVGREKPREHCCDANNSRHSTAEDTGHVDTECHLYT